MHSFREVKCLQGSSKTLIIQDFSPNPMGSQFPIPTLGSLFSESVGAQNFEILVGNSKICFCCPRGLEATPSDLKQERWRNLVRVKCL